MKIELKCDVGESVVDVFPLAHRIAQLLNVSAFFKFNDIEVTVHPDGRYCAMTLNPLKLYRITEKGTFEVSSGGSL